MMAQQQCDVLIVGAGPGGSSAAYRLARAGVDVLLADKAYFPRDKSCGDGLTPRAVGELEKIGLGEYVHRVGKKFTHIDIENYRSSTMRFSLYPNNPTETHVGLVIPRRELDDTLRCHSLAAGARFMPGFTASRLLYSDGWIDVVGFLNHHECVIRAQLVIVATGASRTFPYSSGLTNDARPKAFATRAYVSNLTNQGDGLEIFLDQDHLPGYGWLFPLSESTANVGVGILANSADVSNRRLRMAFNRLMNHPRLSGASQVGSPQGFPIRCDFPDVEMHNERILIVGEAAGLVDPITGEGIGYALESGRIAAQYAMSALSSNRFDCSALSAYSGELIRQYAKYFRESRELIARLDHPRVLEVIASHAQNDSRIQTAFRVAIVDERPRESISLLADVLHANQEKSLSEILFKLNAYKPLLDHCRENMLSKIKYDAPSPSVIELVRRGKMLRALLVFLGCQAAGGDPSRVISGAGGIELVHTASLVHDDVMDEANQRRGVPALHKTLGNSRAVVCGDYLIAKAFQLLAESRYKNDADHVVSAFMVGAESGVLACTGQFHDVGEWSTTTLSQKRYYKVIANKTAAVISGALKAGAVLAGGKSPLLNQLSEYGKCVGLAFQIKDDLLDFADNQCIDRMDRKPSLPLVIAHERAVAQDREIIFQFMKNELVSADVLQEIICRTDALFESRNASQAWSTKAEVIATEIPFISDVLIAFARYAFLREE
jgi:geranylgeranyl reductase family protein